MNTPEQAQTPRTDQCYHDWNTAFTKVGLLSPDELSRQLETELSVATAENARLTMEREHNANMAGVWKACAEKLKEAHGELRDIILHERGQLAEENIPVNMILGVVDDAFSASLAQYARCSSEQPATGWRDISTAPRNTLVLGLLHGDIYIMQLDDSDGYLPLYWCDRYGAALSLYSKKQVKGWLPLPPAPQAVKGEQQG